MTFLHNLRKFDQIRFLQIEVLPGYNVYGPERESFFLKWKATCSTKSHTFFYLSSHSICSKEEYKGEVGEFDIQMPTKYSTGSLGLLALYGAYEASIWFDILSKVIKVNPMLRTVKITNWDKKGIISFTNDVHDSESRDVLIKNAFDRLQMRSIIDVKFGYIPVLHLPVKGFVMEGVVAAMFCAEEDPPHDDCADRYDDILNWDFEEGEEVFGEAVTTIFQNKKIRFFAYDRFW